MANVALYGAGEVGLIADIPTEELEVRAWSDVRNARFFDGKIFRPSMDSAIFGTPLEPPYQIISVQSGTVALWVYASLTKLFATDGRTHTDVTRTVGGNYTIDERDLWSGGSISNVPVISNGFDVPQYWPSPSLGTHFANLLLWPSTYRCKVIKSFKNFLIAMNVTVSGTPYQHLVKWSHPAVPGSLPSWDVADPTLLAGEVEILDELPGGIQDGGGLRDTFIIYKDNATWGMQFVGGNAVFRFFPIFLQSGILSKHCFTEIKDGSAHFVATGDDFIVHDGQNSRSVFNRKIRGFINSRLPDGVKDLCFCVSKPMTKEVWFCFPEEDGRFPTLAAIYNWDNDTCSIRQLPDNGISYMSLGPLGSSSDPWNLDLSSWDSDTTDWDVELFSPHFQTFVGCSPDGNKFYNIEDGETFGSGYIERKGLAISGQDRVTGQIKADNEMMKIFDRIWMKSTGAKFQVSIGGQELADSEVVYQPPQTFIPGVTKYLDFYPVNARFLAIKIEWDVEDQRRTTISGYDINVEKLGQQ